VHNLTLTLLRKIDQLLCSFFLVSPCLQNSLFDVGLIIMLTEFFEFSQFDLAECLVELLGRHIQQPRVLGRCHF